MRKITSLPPKYFKENKPNGMKVTKLSEIGIFGNYSYKWLFLNNWSGWVRNPIVYKKENIRISINEILNLPDVEVEKVSIKLYCYGVHIDYNNYSRTYGLECFLTKIGFKRNYIEITKIGCFSENNQLFVEIIYAKQLAA